MRKEGDYACLDKLQGPAVRVNRNDLQTLRIMDAERRINLWFEIKENMERYEDGECGTFYGDIHNHTMAGFYMALLKLAATFSMNQESFVEIEKIFTSAEIELMQKLERYNSFDIKSIKDVISEIRGGDRTTIAYISDYMNEMEGGWVMVLNDHEIKLPVRDAIRRRMKRRLETLEAGVLEIMKYPGGIRGFLREINRAQGPQQVINIKDSVIIRSEIGSGIGAEEVSLVSRCPRCKREAEKDERFCPECGTVIGGV